MLTNSSLAKRYA